jgi:hypothetical protein
MFWEVFKDDSLRQFEILGTSRDDTLLTNNTAEMIDCGLPVRCETIPLKTYPTEESLRESFEQRGLAYKDGLYNECLKELAARGLQSQ